MSSSRSQKTNQYNFNIPPKFLWLNITSTVNGESYRYPNADDDPWYRLGNTPKPYRWTITASVNTHDHGSNLTREAFAYNGFDVQKGDYIAYENGFALKIIEVQSKTAAEIVVIAEDCNRYNTFKSTDGVGRGGTIGNGYIFSTNESGDPIIDSTINVTDNRFARNLKSAFDYQKTNNNYQLYKSNNSFEIGEVISVTGNGYVKTSSATADRMLGIVSDVGPGAGEFSINPNQKMIDFDPDIPGVQGDFVYVSDSGVLTANSSQSTSQKKIYLIVADKIPTRMFGSNADPVIGTSSNITLNSFNIPFSAGSNLSTIVSTINAETTNTNVIAYATGTATSTDSDDNTKPFGVPAIQVSNSPSAYFDTGSGNTLITFTYKEVGDFNVYGGYAASRDIADQINDAGIANLICSAESDVGLVTLTELNGNSITITNNVNDNDGNPIAGANSGTGFNTSTSAASTQRLVLREDRGWDVNIYDGTNDGFIANTGVTGGHNGRPVTAMNIEQGVGSSGGSSSTVVGNITDRDNLTAQAGDIVYVTNKGDGEWGMYVYDGSAWVLMGTEDSADVDAGVLEATYDVTVNGANTLVTLGNISTGRKINGVTITVNTAFDDVSAIANVGSSTDEDQYVAGDLSDLTTPDSYFIKPDIVTVGVQDTVAVANVAPGSSSVGNVTFKLTYL